jgi:acyl-coenzyme A thioesterase PaaI-like protein
MLATLVDYALEFNVLNCRAGRDEPPALLSTVSLNIDYISAGKVGDWLVVTTHVDKEAGRLRFCHCDMLRDGGCDVLETILRSINADCMHQ